eukprot:g12567.t1
MIITTAGMRRVYGTATGVLRCVVGDTDGLERQVSCDTCLSEKSTQQAHPKTTVHKATEPLGCVYTDTIGPVSPVAEGGYMYAALSHLRVVGARAFIHYEHHREKLQDRAWAGRLVGYSKDSRAYRIYNPATRRVVESRNVTFIETPDATVPPAAADTRDSSFPPDADSRGDVCFGDDSDNNSSVDSGDDGDILERRRRRR